jgi:hypothetical protein
MKRLRGFEFRVPGFEFILAIGYSPLAAGYVCGSEFRVSVSGSELATRNTQPEAFLPSRLTARASRHSLPPRAFRLFLLLLLLLTMGAAPPAKKPKPSRINISTHLDRTAIWVGDDLRYTVRAIHEPEIEFVVDSLTKDNLNLAPFVVRDVAVRQGGYAGNKKLTEVTLQMTTYESGAPELRIPALVLYYFTHKPGMEKNEDTLAESLTVPPTRIGLRSTLTPDARRLRDAREIPAASWERWAGAFAAGFLGLAFLGVQSARWLRTSTAAEVAKTPQPTRRRRGRRVREFLRAAESIGRDSPQDQQRYYAEVSRFLREYLGESLDIHAAGMTPDEVAEALERRGRNGLGPPIKSVLNKCEQVLYTPGGAELGKRWRDDVQLELSKLARSLRM